MEGRCSADAIQRGRRVNNHDCVVDSSSDGIKISGDGRRQGGMSRVEMRRIPQLEIAVLSMTVLHTDSTPNTVTNRFHRTGILHSRFSDTINCTSEKTIL